MLMGFHETSLTGILLMRTVKMRGKQPYDNFKTAHFVKYLGSILMDFHETSITGILLMRLSKIYCVHKTFCIILCLLHSIFTHIHTYIMYCVHVRTHPFCFALSTLSYSGVFSKLLDHNMDKYTFHLFIHLS